MVGTWKCKQNPGQVLLIPTSPLSPPVFFNLYLLEPINFVPACNFLLMLWLFQLKTTRCCIFPPHPVLGPLLCLFSQTRRDSRMLFHPQICESPDIVGARPRKMHMKCFTILLFHHWVPNTFHPPPRDHPLLLKLRERQHYCKTL